jgi:C1A family cysteine protease
MTSLRHALLITLAATLIAFAAPGAAAGATAGTAARLQTGPLNPAFVEALHDPLLARGLGRMPSPVEVDVSPAVEARAARTEFPAAFSLIDEGRVTSPVRSQGSDGTCWAFSNIAALESAILIKYGQETDLSEDNVAGLSGFWTSRAQRYISGGYDFMAVAHFARWAGPLTEAYDPYDGRPRTGKAVNHVQDVVMIPGRGSDLDNDLIKQLVRDNGALSVGMYMDTSQDQPYMESSTSAYYYPANPPYENHGVAVVGWDDAYSATNFVAERSPPGDGAFLVRNSWGAGWGADGYFWVSYYDRGFARDLGLGTYGGCTSYSTVEKRANYSRNYGYDKLGVTDRIGLKDGAPVWGANRFTARSSRPITAAAFYTLASGTTYEVWAGRTFKRLTRRARGTATLPGYHTVKFSKALRVAKGKRFVVAVRLTSPDGKAPLAIERRIVFRDGVSRIVFAPATARRGQSYVGAKRWRFVDLTTQKGLATANVCLKAFAR